MSAKLDLSALKNIDFAKWIAFLKQRWVPITCGLIVIIAPLAAYFSLDFVRAPVVAKIKDRVDAYEKLGGLEKTSVDVRAADGSVRTESAYINKALIEELTKHQEALAADAQGIYQSAVDRNRAGRGVSQDIAEYLPKPKNEAARDVNLLRENALPLLIKQRDALITLMKMSGPSKSDEALDRVQRAETEHLTGVLMKKQRSEVTDPKELAELNARLVDTRLALITENAAGIEVYLRPGAILWRDKLASAKDGDSKAAPAVEFALAQLFQFQWDMWVVEDVLKAIQQVNSKSDASGKRTPIGVVQAPVKCINRLLVTPIPGLVPADAAAGATADASAEAPAGEAIDPKTDVAPDFAASINGLRTNQLFDVRDATLVVVCETTAVPKLVNALSAQNFITVTGLSLVPADTFAAARQGYAFGSQPCSEVTLKLQSVWLRDWTTESMPKGMMAAIKTAGKPAPPEAGASEAPAAGG
ncbi:MAG: hypothetical protein LW625_01125 [Planctomycetaceae bacterium]|nr:hypothetical protein [Planctomycetaceae bacterium]